MKRKDIGNQEDGATRNDGGKSERGNGKHSGARRVSDKEWMQMAVAKAAAEEWWTKSSQSRRVLAMTIATMMEQMTENKRIEIRVEGGAVRARFVHILRQPEKGCLSAIVLPERASGGWN